MRFGPTARASRSKVGAAVASAAVLVALAAPAPAMAASATTSASTVLTLTSKATTGVPATVAPGYHTFILKESAAQAKKDPRGITVLQFAKGYTAKQFEKDSALSFASKYTAAVKKAYTRLTKNTVSVGGIELESDYTMTGDRFTVWLPAGTYAIDNAATQNGAPDNFTVLTVAGKQVGSKPKTVGTITSKEFAFKVAGARAGKHMYALHNAGAQIHMYVMLRLDKGHSLAEIQQALGSNGPPPAWVHNAGFAGVLTAGQTMYTTLNISNKSDYLLVCFMPDLKTGAPHVALGMVRLFSVK